MCPGMWSQRIQATTVNWWARHEEVVGEGNDKEGQVVGTQGHFCQGTVVICFLCFDSGVDSC